jgi:tripartite-type tricarboxylate transporter receptor subunit TctC
MTNVLKSVVAACVALGACAAASAEDFYKDKTVRLIISSSVGGGYDVYARALARHLPRHIPGEPVIEPQNMPAAGGIAAANYLYNVAPKDGTVIEALQNTVPFEPFFDNKLALFDVAKFNWLGTPTSEVAMYMVWSGSKVKTLADAQTIPMVVGAAGAASTPAFYGRLFNDIFHFKARFITGYPGQNEILLAMEAGEVEAMSSPFWSSLKTSRPDWWPQKKVSFLFQYGLHPHPELGDTPFAPNLLTSESDKTLLMAASAPLGIGRPYAAPPGVAPDRLAILRKAFWDTFHDPEFVADCRKQRIECADAHNGDELAALIKQAYGTPENLRQRLIAIQAAGG